MIRVDPGAQQTDAFQESRKTVTIVFADLIGSTSLHERLDAESTRRLMDRYYRALRGAVETHGGTVVKLMGDGVMAAFGVPHVAEDDAIRAVRLLTARLADAIVEGRGEAAKSGVADMEAAMAGEAAPAGIEGQKETA